MKRRAEHKGRMRKGIFSRKQGVCGLVQSSTVLFFEEGVRGHSEIGSSAHV